MDPMVRIRRIAKLREELARVPMRGGGTRAEQAAFRRAIRAELRRLGVDAPEPGAELLERGGNRQARRAAAARRKEA